MFKKEIFGKTNIKSSKGGEDIGFSFYFYINNNYDCYITNIFKSKNRNYKL